MGASFTSRSYSEGPSPIFYGGGANIAKITIFDTIFQRWLNRSAKEGIWTILIITLCRVHGRVPYCIYTTMYMAVYKPYTRSCTHLHGPYTAVDTAGTAGVQSGVGLYTAVTGRVRGVYKCRPARPCTARPFAGRVH